MKKKADPYFTPTGEEGPIVITESIPTEPSKDAEEFEFVSDAPSSRVSFKRIIYTVLALVIVMFSWQIYSTFIEINAHSAWLAIAFSLVVALLLILVAQQLLTFRREALGFKKTEKLRDQSERFVKERTHGLSKEFITELQLVYKNKPQEKYLSNVLNDLPDYLSDAEIVTRLSDDFMSKLDDEAKRLVVKESAIAATMIAVSQLVVVDTIIVVWKVIKMINGISSIYGVSLTKLGQWRLLSQVTKAIFLTGGSQLAINSLAGSISNMGAPIAPTLTSVTQGIGVGSYIAKIGIEAMKQSRPITFADEQIPSVNLITDGIRGAIDKVLPKGFK